MLRVRSRTRLCAAASLLVFVAALCAPVSAAQRFVEQVPDDVASFGSVANYEQFIEKFKATPYYKLFQDPEVQGLIERVGDLISDQIEQFRAIQEEIGVALVDLANVPKGEVAFVQTTAGFQMPMMGGAPPQQWMLMLVDVGDDPAPTRALIDRLLERAAQTEALAVTEEEFRGHAIRHLTLQAGGAGPAMTEEELANLDPELQEMMRQMEAQPVGMPQISLYVSLEDNVLAVAFGTDRSLLERHLLLRDGQGAAEGIRPLSASDLYKQAMAPIDPDSDYLAYQSFQPQWDMIRQMGSMVTAMGMPDFGAILDELGLFSLKAAGSGAKLAADGISGEGFIVIPAPRKGIMKAGEPADGANVKPPAFVGAEAAVYIGSYYDVPALWQDIKKVLAGYLPPEALAQLEFPGSPPALIQELLLGLGENSYVYIPGDVLTTGPDGLTALNVVLAIEVQDAQQSQQTLDDLMATIPPGNEFLTKVNVAGDTYYQTPPIPLPLPGQQMVLSPVCLFFADGKMILAGSDTMRKAVLEGSKRAASPLLKKPDLLASLPHLQKQPDFFMYFDQRLVLGWGYTLVKTFVPPDVIQLPPYDNIGKYLSSSTTTGKWTDQGYLYKSWQPHAKPE